MWHPIPPEARAVRVNVVDGDLLDQQVDAIVNAWNRNVIPWWLLLPQGVSGAIKRRGGTAPFREVARHGPIPLGGAVHTGAGTLPFRGIVHVAGIDLLWRSSERSVRDSTANAVAVAVAHGYRTLAAPVIGAGSGGGSEAASLAWMLDTAQALDAPLALTIVRFRPS